MHRSIKKLAIVVSLTFVMSAQAQPTPQQRHGINFGTFSNLHYIEEAGDLLGIEITIVPQYKTSYAIVQFAEGWPTEPIFVPIELKGNRFHFVLQTGGGSYDGDFSGTISQRGMTLHSPSEMYDAAGFIPRRASYWTR